MKQLKYYMMMLSALLFLGSCSDDDSTTDTGVGAQISLSSDVLQVAKEGGTVSVVVTSDADWRLAGVCDWAHPSATEGQSGDEVTFTVDENTTGEDLSTTFKFFTGASVAPLVIESVQGFTFNLASEETVEVAQEGGQVSIRVESNIRNFSVAFSDGGDAWLSLADQTEFGKNQILRLNVSENETYLQRSSVVSISNPQSDDVIEVTLNQAPTAKFEVTQANLENGLLSCDMSKQSVEMTVVTNLEFEASVTNGQEWISDLQVSTPETAENGLSTYLVSCNLESTEEARVGAVTFNFNGTSQVVSIVQKDPSMPVAKISQDFSEELVDAGWIMPLGEFFLVLEKGLNATVFDFPNVRIEDLTGIESFPNLEVLRFSIYMDMETFDISGLHKVKTLEMTQYSYSYITELNLGDNPITSLKYGEFARVSYSRSLKVISEKLENLDCTMGRYYGSTSTLDVSECPALKTLEAYNFCSSLSTIIKKSGQEIEINKRDRVKIEEI